MLSSRLFDRPTTKPRTMCPRQPLRRSRKSAAKPYSSVATSAMGKKTTALGVVALKVVALGVVAPTTVMVVTVVAEPEEASLALVVEPDAVRELASE